MYRASSLLNGDGPTHMILFASREGEDLVRGVNPSGTGVQGDIPLDFYHLKRETEVGLLLDITMEPFVFIDTLKVI